MIKFLLPLTLCLFALIATPSVVGQASAPTYIPGQPGEQKFEGLAKPFLSTYCIDCHSGGSPEGNLSLEDLGPVGEINVATWKSIWAQVALKEMPPEDGDEPEVIERLRFSDWIIDQLSETMRDKGGFRDHLDPSKANFVDHDLLFNPLPEGIKLTPTSSPARLWRVTPQEHLTRLSALINTEPEFDPKRSGLRANGDSVPTNHGGELKLYFGVDRIIDWQGGTVAYASSIKSVPAALSSARKHGLENYPDFYTVNSAQSTQILGIADDIIRYMAYGPLSIASPEQITDDPESYVMKGDLRGLPSSLVYSTKLVRPVTPIIDLMQADTVNDEKLLLAVNYLFEALTFRPPRQDETDAYLAITKQSIEKLGKKEGVVLGLSSIFLDRDAVFRAELVEYGNPDQHGRVMLQDWELGLAVNHALRYIKPDAQLREAIVQGRMRTRADVEREVKRMLVDPSIRKPRVLRFFRDYFDYDLGGYICKDSTALRKSGATRTHYRAMFDATASTDRLIELILEEDQDVLKQLLTTDKVVATKGDRLYFGTRGIDVAPKALTAQEKAAKKKQAAARKAELESELIAAKENLAEVKKALKDTPDSRAKGREINGAKRLVTAVEKKLARPNPKSKPNIKLATLSGPKIYARVGRRSFGKGSLEPERTLATVPEGERLGILTHPSWLVSHSDAMDNHAIHRGRWIRERLLGGGIPDVPITVDAMLPDEPRSTLRKRMRVTTESYCWTCHKKMDPLGLPFEMYNHAGLFRTTELGKPVDTSGAIIDSGDAELDGQVADALEMIQKLAESHRAEQVFVRHAFRFWMGRNETLNDGPVLQAAHRAYRDNGGSMNALILSLLTSDAFLYRTRGQPEAANKN